MTRYGVGFGVAVLAGAVVAGGALVATGAVVAGAGVVATGAVVAGGVVAGVGDAAGVSETDGDASGVPAGGAVVVPGVTRCVAAGATGAPAGERNGSGAALGRVPGVAGAPASCVAADTARAAPRTSTSVIRKVCTKTREPAGRGGGASRCVPPGASRSVRSSPRSFT